MNNKKIKVGKSTCLHLMRKVSLFYEINKNLIFSYLKDIEITRDKNVETKTQINDDSTTLVRC